MPPVGGEQAVPLAASALAGQAPELPVHDSAGSQGPVEARHCVPAATKVQPKLQQFPAVPLLEPLSHCSPLSTIPLPHGDGLVQEPDWQVPPLGGAHAVPLATAVCPQETLVPDGVQVSLVQMLASSQLTVVGVVLHAPEPLQKNLLPVRPEQLAVPQGVALDALVCPQVMADPDALQVSLVQTLASSQLTVVGVVLHAPEPLQKNLLPVRPEQLAVPQGVALDALV